MNHNYYMNKAIELALKANKKLIKSNPFVGCVIVKNNEIIGEGFHEIFGENHAEINAINNATQDLEGSTLYVTLDPCCHFGKTPPCTDAIIKNKIKTVVIGDSDSNPLVKNKSIEILKANNIKVITGVLFKECHALNKVFHYNQITNYPYVKLKYAMSVDGKINLRSNEYLTCLKSREQVHKDRMNYDAIMVGINTVVVDDPLLTVRHVPIEDNYQPIRIICDTNLKISLDSQIIKTASQYKTIIATCSNNYNKIELLNNLNVSVVICKSNNNLIDLNDLLMKLYKEFNISNIYLEGGSKLIWSFVNQNLINELDVFIAPIIIGDLNSKTPISGCGFQSINECLKLKPIKVKNYEKDILINYEVIK